MGSVQRASRILKLLSVQEKPLGLSAISHQLGIPKSTAHGIVTTLVQERLVEVDETVRYSIGLGALEVGTAYLRRSGAAPVVMPELVRLMRELAMTAHWAILDRDEVVYLCKEDPPGQGIRLASAIGARLPAATTAVGKCCLAWLPPDQLASHLEAGGRDLVTELGDVREFGYALDAEETAAGITCVAAPVFDLGGPRGAIGVSFLTGAADLDAVTKRVRAAAEQLNRALGGTSAAQQRRVTGDAGIEAHHG
ncbi:MAG: IclR family transcriptional regulator [Solirubrobacteraceae bacterium]